MSKKVKRLSPDSEDSKTNPLSPPLRSLQRLPQAPHAKSKFLAAVERELAAFEEKEAAAKPGHQKKPVEIRSLGGELASYHLGFLMHADAPRAVAEFDKLWEDPEDKVARDPWMANLYWQAGALTALGRVDWTCHGDSPTSMVYTGGPAKSRTLIAWNPSAQPTTVRFFEGSKQFGELVVQPYSIASAPAPRP